MIELYELRQFLAFAKAGTLSEASETLHLSQPALSRNMKKLEEDLGIALFLRQKNRLELNENGMYVLELTKKLLEDADLLVAKARDYDRRNRTITLGLCAPAPAWLLTPLISNLYPHMTLQTELKDEERLLKDLENHVYHLAVVHRQPKDGLYYVKECGREKLSFSLPKGHKYARRKSLSFQEMNGENMLLMSETFSTGKKCRIPVFSPSMTVSVSTNWWSLPPCLPLSRISRKNTLKQPPAV